MISKEVQLGFDVDLPSELLVLLGGEMRKIVLWDFLEEGREVCVVCGRLML